MCELFFLPIMKYVSIELQVDFSFSSFPTFFGSRCGGVHAHPALSGAFPADRREYLTLIA